MKLVTAIIRPEQLPAVKTSLFERQIEHLTATMVKGTASDSEQRVYRGIEEKVTLFNRLKLEVAVTDADVENAIQGIITGAKMTGGFGRIFVTELHDAITIWSGERGNRALK